MMAMTATDPGTGIYLVTVQLDGRTLEYAGTEDEYTDWLAELGSVETVLDLDVHEFTEDELYAYGPIWDSPGTSPEEDYA
jgi:hypothetical protein